MEISKKIKIAQVFDGYSEFYQPYIPPVLEKLKERKELSVEVFAFKKGAHPYVTYIPTYYKRKLKEKIYNVWSSGRKKLTYAEIIFLQEKFEVVHLQHSYLFPKVMGLLSMPIEKRPKVVVTLRGGDTYVKPWIQDKWKSFYRDKAKHIDAFVTMSHHQKNYLHEKWGVSLDKIHVIPISFGEKFKISPKNADREAIKIVSVFRMCWEKNIDGNLRVVKYLVEKGLPAQYHLYGEGPDAGQVCYLIDKYGLKNHVTYHGRMENKELKKQLCNSDFLLQLSHSEAFPTTVIEAQSNGLPALVSTAGGLPEAIVPNKSGYCIETHETQKGADHIEHLWRNPEIYLEFSTQSIENTQLKFSIENEAERLERLYLDMC